MSGNTTYCATKSFATFMAHGLYGEYKGKVDILAYCPGEVGTKLINQEGKSGGNVLSLSEAADMAFRDVGVKGYAVGSFWHEFFYWAIGCVSLNMI